MGEYFKTVNSDTFQTVINEERFQNLTNELRCLVANQTIAESNATLAVDLKKQVAKQITEGKSDQKFFNSWKSDTANSYYTLLPFLQKTLYSGWAHLSYLLLQYLFYLLLLSVKVNRRNRLTVY